MDNTNTKKKMAFPHTLIIILIMIAFAAILTYLIPAGQYERIEVAGRKVVDPASYHMVDANPATLFDIFTAIPSGMKAVASIANMVLIIGGSFAVIEATGATKAMLAKVLKMGGHLGAALLPIVIIAFSMLPAFTGNAESMLAFVPLGILFARTLGFDAMVGVSITIAAGNAGFASGLFNTMTTGVAQTLLGIEMFSGLWFRAIGYILLLCSVCFWTVWYALRVKKNPARSCCYDVEQAAQANASQVNEIDSELTTRRLLVLIEFAAGIGCVIYGALNGWDFGTQIAAVFLIMAIVCGLTGGFSGNRICDEFVAGARRVLVGALVVGFAKAISLVMDQAFITDTIVYAFSSLLSGMPKVIGALFMYIFQVIMNCFIISGSGQAAATIPIMGPLGDVLGLSPQTVVTAFIFGDGLTNLLLPMSAATMGAVAIAGITYGQYVKYIWRIILTNLCIGGAMVVIATIIHL
ncbi:MAG: YfcC family protein [Enterocloster citroniae]|nr:YfcC family protein [Enterocloster citroniae]